MPLVSFQMVSKYFGAQCVLQDISWGIEPGHHVGLIGSNGAGKTTILQLITGELPPDDGEISRRRNLQIGYLTQETILDSNKTVFEEILSNFEGSS